jgi:hypothetical protein
MESSKTFRNSGIACRFDNRRFVAFRRSFVHRMSASISCSFERLSDATSIHLTHYVTLGQKTKKVYIDDELSIGSSAYGLAGFVDFSVVIDL